jgi:hypothetical protein
VEVKENIYEHALRDGGFFKVPLSITTRNEYTNLPPVCRTNKLERSIATLVLIRNSIIRLKRSIDIGFLCRWLDMVYVVQTKFMTTVNKMQVYYPGSHYTYGFIRNLIFASKFPALTDLSIAINSRGILNIAEGNFPLYRNMDDDDSDDDMDYVSDSEEEDKLASRDETLSAYGLSHIARCENLIRLTLHVPNTIESYGIDDFDISHVDKVADWCKETFMEANSRALTVEMVCFKSSGKSIRTKAGKDAGRGSDLTWVEKSRVCAEDEALGHNLKYAWI